MMWSISLVLALLGQCVLREKGYFQQILTELS